MGFSSTIPGCPPESSHLSVSSVETKVKKTKNRYRLFPKVKMAEESWASFRPSSVYEELRVEGMFCDAVLKVDDVEFQVHKVVMCECAPYFRALFTRWSRPGQKDYVLPGLSAAMMKLVVEFAYTGRAPVTARNVQELMLAADQFCVMGLVRRCGEFLEKRLCSENCVRIWQFTEICLSARLRSEAFRYILHHFEEVISGEEFRELTARELSDIMARDDLNVRKESALYEGLRRWIAHKPREREEHIATLLSKVRLCHMSRGYIERYVRTNKLVNRNAECSAMVANATNILRRLSVNSSPPGIYNPFVRPRLPNAVLLATGGWSGAEPTNIVESYDFRADRWIAVGNLGRERAYHGTAFLDGFVYWIGGYNRVEYFNGVSRFHVNARTWEEVSPMHFRRCYVSVTVLNGRVYCLGGHDGYTRLNTAECYSPETNQWTLLPPMHEQRSDSSCTALHNKIYICGGFNGTVFLRSAEYYNTDTKSWTKISPMTSCRSGVGVIAYGECIYAVGGFDGNNRLKSAECYHPRINFWRQLPSMLTKRSNFGIEVLDDKLFVVGGLNDFTASRKVEFYDRRCYAWSAACDMDLNRCALSCCVLSGLSDMDGYTIPRNTLPCRELQDDDAESNRSV